MPPATASEAVTLSTLDRLALDHGQSACVVVDDQGRSSVYRDEWQAWQQQPWLQWAGRA